MKTRVCLKYFVNYCILLFSDTDSLVYEIKKVDVYEDFYQDKYLLDFNEYSSDSKFFDPVKKKLLAK